MPREPAAGAFRIETLLAHREWMARTARALVRGDAEAGDLEQDAWLGILERPPAEPPRSPRAWLASVLRFRAVDRARAAGARRRHEERAARPEAGGPAVPDVVSRAEVAERVARAVLELEEPFRTTVLLRYFEGLGAPAVAARMGVPPATVRTRLHRALERLRERLDGECGGERRAWVLALAPAPVGTGRGRVPPAAGGGIAMGIAAKAGIALGVVAVAAGAWIAARPGDGGAAPAGPGPGTAPAAAAVPAAAPPGPAEGEGEGKGRGAAAPESPPPAPEPPKPAPGPAPKPAAPEEEALRRRVEEEKTRFSFDGQTLEDALEFLSARHGIGIVVDPEARDRGRKALPPITRDNSPLARAFDDLAGLAGGLAWEVRGGAVHFVPAAAGKEAAPKPPADPDGDLLRRLREIRTDVAMTEGTALRDALEWLRSLTGAEVVVDAGAEEAVARARVSLRLRGVDVPALLDGLLESTPDLAWEVKGGKIHVKGR